MSPADLEARFLKSIPLARAMSVRVAEVDADGVTLAAPLAPNNINHEGTAFGGSLHAIAVLAGWALVTRALAERTIGYLVIQDSRISYLRPVTNDFTVRAIWMNESRFFDGIRRKGVARAEVQVTVVCAGETCATLNASFVAKART